MIIAQVTPPAISESYFWAQVIQMAMMGVALTVIFMLFRAFLVGRWAASIDHGTEIVEIKKRLQDLEVELTRDFVAQYASIREDARTKDMQNEELRKARLDVVDGQFKELRGRFEGLQLEMGRLRDRASDQGSDLIKRSESFLILSENLKARIAALEEAVERRRFSRDTTKT